jgi:hypothetical protein
MLQRHFTYRCLPSGGQYRVASVILMIAIALSAIGAQPSAVSASDGTCVERKYSHVGGYRKVSNYGARATLEWDQPYVCSADFSTTWPMSVSADHSKYVQSGWFRETGWANTRVFVEWVDQYGKWGRFTGNNNWGTGSVQFAVYRNWVKPATTWCGSAGTTEIWCRGSMSYPKDEVQFYAETARTENRMFGTSRDPNTLNGFGWRDGNKAWNQTYALCNTKVVVNHYRGCRPAGTVVYSFDVWDDRR